MAPTSHHYCPVPMDDNLKPEMRDRKLLGCLGILLLLVVVVGLLVGLIIFAVRANSKACKDGLAAQQKCQNFTHLLKRQLTQVQEFLQGIEAQASTCNQTVVTLTAALEMEKAQGHKQQELVQDLQKEIVKLKQKLQDTSAELERLRKENKASGWENGSTSSGNTISPVVVSVLLILSLGILLT